MIITNVISFHFCTLKTRRNLIDRVQIMHLSHSALHLTMQELAVQVSMFNIFNSNIFTYSWNFQTLRCIPTWYFCYTTNSHDLFNVKNRQTEWASGNWTLYKQMQSLQSTVMQICVHNASKFLVYILFIVPD